MSDRKKLDIYVGNLDCEAEAAAITRGLERLVYGLRLAKRNRQVVRQNLTLSAVVIGAFV